MTPSHASVPSHERQVLEELQNHQTRAQDRNGQPERPQARCSEEAALLLAMTFIAIAASAATLAVLWSISPLLAVIAAWLASGIAVFIVGIAIFIAGAAVSVVRSRGLRHPTKESLTQPV